MTATYTTTTIGAETNLRAAARRRGFTMKELAGKMGVTAGYLSRIAMGGRPWTPAMRQKAMAVLGEVPAQGVVYRQGGVVNGESSYIRERARERGMSMQDLADRVGVSYGYMVRAARGRRNMSVKVQARLESSLRAQARVAPEQCAGIDREAVWERMRAHGISQNEVARRAGISTGHLSQIMNSHRIPSPGVLKRLHEVLFQRTQAERVMPAQNSRCWGGARASGGGWSSEAQVALGAGTEEASCGPAEGCPRALRWTSRTAPATTAGAGCR